MSQRPTWREVFGVAEHNAPRVGEVLMDLDAAGNVRLHLEVGELRTCKMF